MWARGRHLKVGHRGNHPGVLYEQELKETRFTWKEGLLHIHVLLRMRPD